MSAVYTATMTTPRLRLPRPTPSYNDRSRSSATTTDFVGPSRLPEFSQLVDVDLHDMARSESSDQPTIISKVSTPSTVVRAEDRAATLRALLARLPEQKHSPAPSQIPDQYPSERESDYDMSDRGSVTPSVAQESLKGIFSKARLAAEDTPLKTQPRWNGLDTTQVESSRVLHREKDTGKGKGRSLSDDDNDETNVVSTSRSRRKSRSSPQPLTAEFLRERFSESFAPPVGETSNNSSNETATLLRDFDTSHPSPPMATSTPQQSMRMSVSMDLHSNLLDQDTEMQHAIEGLDSYEGDADSHQAHNLEFPRRGTTPTARKDVGREYLNEESSHDTSARSKPRYSLTPRPTRSAIGITKRPSGIVSEHGRFPSEQPDAPSSDEERDEVAESLRSNSNSEQSYGAHDVGSQSFYDRQEVEESLKSELGERDDSVPSHQSFMDEREVEESLQSGFDQSSYLSKNASQSFASRHRDQESLRDFPHHDIRTSRVERSLTPLQGASSQMQNSFATPRRINERTSKDGAKQLDWDSVWQEDSQGKKVLGTPFSPTISPLDSVNQANQSGNPAGEAHTNEAEPSYEFDDSSPKGVAQVKDSRRTIAPSFVRSPTTTRDGSLRTMGNIYHDNTRQIPPQSSSPLLSSSKARPTSPNASSLSIGKSKTLSTPRFHTDDSFVPPDVSSRLPSRSSKELSQQVSRMSYHEDSSMSLTQIHQNEHINEHESHANVADQAGFSSHQEGSGDEFTGATADNSMGSNNISQPISGQGAYAIPPGTPSLFLEEHTPRAGILQEVGLSPSTPPRRSTPKSARRDYCTPSPPERLPDLPTPSSSDEADPSPMKKRTSRSKASRDESSRWMPTPRPPGGWAATPRHHPDSAQSQGSDADEHSRPYPSLHGATGGEDAISHLDTIGKTPKPPGGWFATPAPGPSKYNKPLGGDGAERLLVNEGNLTTVGKTPKPPGGWSTTPLVGLSSSRAVNGQLSNAEISEHNGGLLTPMSTLSKGNSLDPKTPHVPGGWLATPAVRKSILKVRFNSETPSRPADRSERSGGFLPETSNYLQPGSSSPALSSSPRSPRQSKISSIRVVDAYGREERTPEPGSPDNTARMLDAHGHEIDVPNASPVEVEQTEISHDIPFLERQELLSRIRHGLDELADEFASTEETEEDVASRKRIQELQAKSEQARRARERLKSGSSLSDISAKQTLPIDTRSRFRLGWRLFVTNLVLLLSGFIVLYWGISTYFYGQYISRYYDPFNPELNNFHSNSVSHLADARFSNGISWYLQLPTGADILESIWKLWKDDTLLTSPKNHWVPT
ncbi:hypothetical protein D9613_000558 [Agrocybe pediades]|uniref:Uncharacterized protein n=1 Tax=Agrocybe pediades TaxID=84607 RepID=A0A8H4VUR5_9AGAR|nr:hypothetical protein D9613_000558 [Agrocybe pediades]